MKELILEKNKKFTLTDQYGEKVVIANLDDKYFISSSNKTFGPFIKIFYGKSKDNNNDLFFNGFNLTESLVLRMGINGIEEVEKIDTSEIVANVIRKNAKFINFDECKFLGSVGNFRLYKDLSGRFFAVDITKPLKPESKYKKFDSYTELIYYGYQNGVKLYNQDVTFEYENKPIKDFLTSLKKDMNGLFGNNKLIERANIILPKIQWLKKVVGDENFIKGNFEIKIYKSGYKLINMKLANEKISNYEEFTENDIKFISKIMKETPDLLTENLSESELVSNTFIRQAVKTSFDKFCANSKEPVIEIIMNGKVKVFKYDINVIEEVEIPENNKLIIKSIYTNKKSCKHKDEYVQLAILVHKKILEIYKKYKSLSYDEILLILAGKEKVNDR